MKTFAETLCEWFGCAPEEFVRVALRRSLYPRARLLSRVLPIYLRPEDSELLEAAGRVRTEEELRELLREYWDDLHLRGGVMAKRYKLRVSGDRLLKLFGQVMRERSGAKGDARKTR